VKSVKKNSEVASISASVPILVGTHGTTVARERRTKPYPESMPVSEEIERYYWN